MCQVFVLLTCGVPLDVFGDPRFCTGPKVFFVDVSDCFILTGVAIDGPFVPYVHQFSLKSLIQGNDEALSFGVSPE